MDMSAGIFNPRNMRRSKAPKAMMSLQQMIAVGAAGREREVIKSLASGSEESSWGFCRKYIPG